MYFELKDESIYSWILSANLAKLVVGNRAALGNPEIQKKKKNVKTYKKFLEFPKYFID